MKGKYTKRRGVATKTMVMVLALVLVIGISVGGTLAWLTAQTSKVTNTFTVGDINITLTETTGEEYKMVPGNTLSKNPTVGVTAGSEACWLFVKIEESTTLDSFISYSVDEGWNALDGVAGVYYREVSAETAAAGTTYAVLANNQVKVLDTVTKRVCALLLRRCLACWLGRRYYCISGYRDESCG